MREYGKVPRIKACRQRRKGQKLIKKTGVEKEKKAKMVLTNEGESTEWNIPRLFLETRRADPKCETGIATFTRFKYAGVTKHN